MTQKKPLCPMCDSVHPSNAAQVAGFFRPGPRRYRSLLGGPLRDTRAEAEADYCATKRGDA